MYSRPLMSVLCVVAISLGAPSVSALEPAEIAKLNCTGATGNPSEARSFGAGTKADAVDAYLKRKVVCPNSCYNIDISLSVDYAKYSLTVTTKGENACRKSDSKPQDEQRGCAKGETNPTITVRSPAIFGKLPEPRVEGPKSRCNYTKIAGAIGMFANGNIADGFAMTASLEQPVSGAPQPLDKAQYASILRVFDPSVTDAQVGDAIKNKPDALKVIADCYRNWVACDGEKFNESLKSVGVSLTDDVKNSISRFEAKLREEQQAAGVDVDRGPAGGQTFGEQQVTDIDQARCAIARNESGSCQGNYNAINCQIPDCAWGKYQVRGNNLSSWTRQYCGQVMGPYQFLANPWCQEKVFEEEFGRNMERCGFAGAAAKWFSGSCTIRAGGDGNISIANYVNKALSAFNGTRIPFAGVTGAYTGGISPLARVNPFDPYGYYQDRVVCTGTGHCYLANWEAAYQSSYPYPVSTDFPVSTGLPVSTGAPVSTGGVVSTGSPIPTQSAGDPQGTLVSSNALQPVLTLLAQPRQSSVGKPITVAWSTVGMRTEPACLVLVQGTSTPSLVAQSNEGSRSLTPRSAGTLTFTLKCISLAGVPLEQGATVTVR